MEISVLATKCRFCGEEVGRPREEQRTLTIEDLGGETIRHYAPSNSVMEALEAFRSEESFRKEHLSKEPKKRQSIFGRQASSIPEGNSSEIPETQLPPLDAYSRSLAAGLGISPTLAKTTPRRARKSSASLPVWARNTIALGVAGLIVFFLGLIGFQAAPKIRAMVISRNEQLPAPRNPAIALIESGADPLDILDVAARHQRKYDNAESRQTLEEAKKRVKEHVESLLSRNPYDRKNLSTAWDVVSKAHSTYPSEDLLQLKNRVSAEVRLYGAMLLKTDLDSKPPVAEFLMVDPDMKESHITVKEGDFFWNNRFQLTLVKRDEVCIVDTAYDNRKLRCNKATGITKF